MRVMFNVDQPSLRFWFSVKEDDTILKLQEKVISDLKLSFRPSKVTLFLENCILLPEHYVKDVLRENDLIHIKPKVSRKRKPEEELAKVEDIKKKEKKTKREDESKLQKKYDQLIKQFEKIRKEKEEEAQNELERKKEYERLTREHKKEQERLAREHQKEQKRLSRENEIQKEEAEKEKKRLNEERKKFKKEQKELKRCLKEIKKEIKSVESQEPKSNKAQLETPKESAIVPSEDQNTVAKPSNKVNLEDYEFEESNHVEKDNKNLFGRAIVTYSEAVPEKYRRKPGNKKYIPKQYPINKTSKIFYAEQPTEEVVENKNKVAQKGEAIVSDNIPVNKNITQEETPAIINYEEYPKVDFEKNLPIVGDFLAIKTLELTATYTPEISDWKEVKLVEIDFKGQSVVVEFQNGFSKTSTKGGKFDLRKKKYDYYYQPEIEEEEDEEEEEERVNTYLFTDIFEIRKI